METGQSALTDMTGASCRLTCVQQSILDQDDCDAIVIPASELLEDGTGVTGLVHRAAGPALGAACRRLAPISIGQAVVTPGFRLKNGLVIHAAGPHYIRHQQPQELLRQLHRNILLRADEHRAERIAIPGISIGMYRFPVEEAAGIAVHTVRSTIPALRFVREVRFVMFEPRAYEAYLACLGA
jgi:O-acetyl-ADP-ribose deacetylase (regulator of RNase III)